MFTFLKAVGSEDKFLAEAITKPECHQIGSYAVSQQGGGNPLASETVGSQGALATTRHKILKYCDKY